MSASLVSHDAYAYRSAVGGLLYLARDRPDLLFSVKELSAKMAHPTVTALQRLKKVIVYVNGTSTYAVVMSEPEGGQGKWKNTNTSFWCWKAHAILTGVQARSTERVLALAFI